MERRLGTGQRLQICSASRRLQKMIGLILLLARDGSFIFYPNWFRLAVGTKGA
jgi:hypothetical protein